MTERPAAPDTAPTAADTGGETHVTLRPGEEIWQRTFTVAPLVVIGSREMDGGYDLAPKHMATPLGWGPWFGFVCTPAHATYRNVRREGVFTVSFPGPEHAVLTSLTASPRDFAGIKRAVEAAPTVAAREVDGLLLEGALLHLECRLDRVVDGFGDNSLVAGRVVAAHVRRDALRGRDKDDHDLIARRPLLAYLHPGRYAKVERSFSFPLPVGFNR